MLVGTHCSMVDDPKKLCEIQYKLLDVDFPGVVKGFAFVDSKG